jgi:2-polyprenyl-3-methyl-5-hydroxy-6-metoxy-1,4-benzoquinol methylase/uncharacterized protein YbaR (Trm112 family)
MSVDDWLRRHLVCPRDRLPLQPATDELVCQREHRYPVVDGVPVLLLDGVNRTLEVAWGSIKAASQSAASDHVFLDTLGCEESERLFMQKTFASGESPAVDPVVQYMLLATNGNLYRTILGSLTRYPIPDIRLPPGEGRTVLDVGCGWGRWTIAAAQKNYRAVGIDPSLGAIMAARRSAAALGVDAGFIVADARYLPFSSDTYSVVFSYSVLQHFGTPDLIAGLREVARVLRPGGFSLIQMANALGLRNLQHQARRGFRPATDFEVYYRLPGELKAHFSQCIGPTSTSVDCFFGLGLQPSDGDLLPARYRPILAASEALRRLSTHVPFMDLIADSIYLESHKPPV